MKTQKQRRNPFNGAKDLYLTKNKIAVTRTKNISAQRSHTTTEKTKYYEQNDSNIKLLKAATGGIVRVGRTGNNYKNL